MNKIKAFFDQIFRDTDVPPAVKSCLAALPFSLTILFLFWLFST